ncbi:hypothetical protein AZI85_07325 [Bdellovibrio bacteriovorus]|uniref:Cation/H+ exchanger transmembrane domain-containing protein n=1 Tax=Bdellovibrio bacteriovorus TaxID=959 RepID=A0A150WG45_BDEBC|nr:cation:proton antiporter [Bdellovibrio bacteriovorus]KYG62006.1 hypothetical protein AZI85_07325 [Bdellovibrio bacteriovorus]
MKLIIWIVLGLCLGPGVTDITMPSWMPQLAQVAGAGFLFLAGWELQFVNLRKDARFYALSFIGSFVIPFFTGYFLFERNWFLAIAFSISALPIVIQILKERNLYGSRLSRRTITVASLCDIVAWVVLAFLLPKEDVVGWLMSHWVVLAFFIGMALGRWKEFPRDTHLISVQMWILAPVFFIVLGWKIDILGLFSLKTFLLIFVAAVTSKLVGTYIFTRFAGVDSSEAIKFSFLLNARGAMEILAASYAYQAQLISGDIFAALVLLGILTALMAVPAVNASGKGA